MGRPCREITRGWRTSGRRLVDTRHRSHAPAPRWKGRPHYEWITRVFLGRYDAHKMALLGEDAIEVMRVAGTSSCYAVGTNRCRPLGTVSGPTFAGVARRLESGRGTTLRCFRWEVTWHVSFRYRKYSRSVSIAVLREVVSFRTGGVLS